MMPKFAHQLKLDQEMHVAHCVVKSALTPHLRTERDLGAAANGTLQQATTMSARARSSQLVVHHVHPFVFNHWLTHTESSRRKQRAQKGCLSLTTILSASTPQPLGKLFPSSRPHALASHHHFHRDVVASESALDDCLM